MLEREQQTVGVSQTSCTPDPSQRLVYCLRSKFKSEDDYEETKLIQNKYCVVIKEIVMNSQFCHGHKKYQMLGRRLKQTFCIRINVTEKRRTHCTLYEACYYPVSYN